MFITWVCKADEECILRGFRSACAQTDPLCIIMCRQSLCCIDSPQTLGVIFLKFLTISHITALISQNYGHYFKVLKISRVY